MTKKTSTLGFDGPVHDDQGRRVIAPSSETLLMDFRHYSPRSYEGKASGISGHNGMRHGKKGTPEGEGGKPGSFAEEHADRKRWTTALKPEALEVLHDLAVELRIRRCDVVERLLLNPEAVALLRAR